MCSTSCWSCLACSSSSLSPILGSRSIPSSSCLVLREICDCNERKFCRLNYHYDVRGGGVLAVITWTAMLAGAETPVRATNARQDRLKTDLLPAVW